MLPLGTVAPDFELLDAHERMHRLRDAKGRPTLLLFLCNHCPFVQPIRSGLAALGTDYLPRGVAIFGINSSDVDAYPEEAPHQMVQFAESSGWTFPYLVDADQRVAKAYHAACTPACFVLDRKHQIVYRGQFDGSRPDNDVAVTGKDVRAALDAVLAGKHVRSEQQPGIGSYIQWRPGTALLPWMHTSPRPRFAVIRVERLGRDDFFQARSTLRIIDEEPTLWEGDSYQEAHAFALDAMPRSPLADFYICDVRHGSVEWLPRNWTPHETSFWDSRWPSAAVTLLFALIGAWITPRPLEVLAVVVYQLPAVVHLLLGPMARWNTVESSVPAAITLLLVLIFRA